MPEMPNNTEEVAKVARLDCLPPVGPRLWFHTNALYFQLNNRCLYDLVQGLVIVFNRASVGA